MLKFNGIYFDDWSVDYDYDPCDDYDHTYYWSQICESCQKRFADKIINAFLDHGAPGEEICGVNHCQNVSEAYIDFGRDVEII